MPQEHQAVAILPARVGIREVHADITQRERSERCVGDGVRENIGIGVAFQAECRGNDHSAQDHRPAGYDTMHVPALADSKFAQDPVTQLPTLAVISSARKRRARSMSEGLVIFKLRSLPGTTLTST